MKKHIAPILLAIAIFVPAIVLVACPQPGSKVSVPTHLIECAKDATRARSLDALESVTAVLVSAGGQNWMDTAKSQIFELAAKWGHDAVACALGLKRQQFAAAANNNPDDETSSTAAIRADMLLEDIGYQVQLN